MDPIKVLVVDDSSVVRTTLQRELERDPGIQVIGTAIDPYVAREKIVELKPDVITLDIEMPRMDGLTFLKKLMQHYPIPVIIVSSLSASGSQVALQAIDSGAVDVMCKPGSHYFASEMGAELCHKVHAAARVNMKLLLSNAAERSVAKPRPAFTSTTDKVIVIGASTGGTNALERILLSAPPNCPPIVIVQHMPAGFTKAFAERLDQMCAIHIKEAADGDKVVAGQALIAPGNFHTLVECTSLGCTVCVKTGPLVTGHRPSVDVLFNSAARSLGTRAVGIMLTGMGGDGSEGMLKMREAGAYNIAQDEASCVVFGMPRVAIEKGAVHKVLPLDSILTEALRATQSSLGDNVRS